MKRLIKIVTICLLMLTCLMPLLECFDRWDRPGLGNDTEMPVFLIGLFVSFVLMVLIAIARRFHEDQARLEVTEIRYETLWCIFSPVKHIVFACFLIPPLRI
jgi:hypothetical protein